MRLSRATLKATETADGNCGLRSGVKLGTLVYVDLDQVRELAWSDQSRMTSEVRLSIFVEAAENGTQPGWMPVELLDIPELEEVGA